MLGRDKMQAELEKLNHLPVGSLSFNDQQITFMQNNVGNLDPYLRDDLIYSLFSRGFEENAFTQHQQKTIVDSFIQDKNLFKNIDSDNNDFIFLRSFSALLGAIILDKDNKTPFLTQEQRLTMFIWSIEYLKKETDYRGFVANKGWAHGIAHGSDFLGTTLQHKLATENITVDQALNIIPKIFQRINMPFLDEEEARLAYAFYLGLKSDNISAKSFNNFIISFDKQLWGNYTPTNLSSTYQLNTWLHLLEHWFFFITGKVDTKKILKQRINNYYNKMGFEL